MAMIENAEMNIESNDEEEDEDEDVVASPPYDGPFDFEIVGLHMNDNGRSCCEHEVCGMYLKRGDVVKLVSTIVKVNGEDENAIVVATVFDAEVRCKVGFVPRVQATVLSRRDNSNNAFRYAIVKDIYSNNVNSYKATKSKRNYGMASCVFIDNIANFEDE